MCHFYQHNSRIYYDYFRIFLLYFSIADLFPKQFYKTKKKILIIILFFKIFTTIVSSLVFLIHHLICVTLQYCIYFKGLLLKKIVIAHFANNKKNEEDFLDLTEMFTKNKRNLVFILDSKITFAIIRKHLEKDELQT